MRELYIDVPLILLVYLLLNLLCLCIRGLDKCMGYVIEYMEILQQEKELQTRKRLLEERTNPEIANLILSFL